VVKQTISSTKLYTLLVTVAKKATLI